jgi:Spy/CpxP family protein refolding chaperone
MQTRPFFRRPLIALLGVFALFSVAGASGCRSRHDPAAIKKYVAKKIDKALDQINASADQRATVHAVRDRLFTVVEQNRTGQKAMLEEALQLFEGDLNPARVETLRSEHEARQKAMQAEVMKGLREIHAVLRPEQRKQITTMIRDRIMRWHR